MLVPDQFRKLLTHSMSVIELFASWLVNKPRGQIDLGATHLPAILSEPSSSNTDPFLTIWSISSPFLH